MTYAYHAVLFGVPLYKNKAGYIKIGGVNGKEITHCYPLIEKTFLKQKFNDKWKNISRKPIRVNGYEIKPDYKAYKERKPVFIEIKNWDTTWENVSQVMRYIISLDRTIGYKEYELYLITSYIDLRRRTILENLGVKIFLHHEYLEQYIGRWGHEKVNS